MQISASLSINFPYLKIENLTKRMGIEKAEKSAFFVLVLCELKAK